MNVVIAGCPRSGTSIFGELFDAHPDFKYYFEPAVRHIPSELHPLGMWRWAMKNPIVFPVDRHGPLDERIEGAINSRTPGLAFNIEDIKGRVPEAQFIWIVRHPLDTASSLVPGLTGDVWMHPPRPPDYKELVRQDEPYMRAAKYWRWVNGDGYLNLSSERPLVVRYERLITDTFDVVNEVLAYVDAPWHESLDNYVSRVTNDVGGYQAAHQDRWLRRDHMSHIGRWRETLTEVQADGVWGHVCEVAERFGYSKDEVEENDRRNSWT